jgi:hypothetical protein
LFFPNELTRAGQEVSFESPTNGAIPLSIEFVVGGTYCGATNSAVVLNTFPQAILPPFLNTANSCRCGDCETKTGTGNVLDFNPTGTNTITMNVGAGLAESVGYIQVCIEYCG